MPAQALVAEGTGSAGARLSLSGDLRLDGLAGVLPQIEAMRGPAPLVIDGAGIESFDTAGAWAIASLRRRLKAEGAEVRIEGLSPPHQELLATVEAALPPEEKPPARAPGFVLWLDEIGQGVAECRDDAGRILSLLGAVIARLAGNLLHPSRHAGDTRSSRTCSRRASTRCRSSALMAFLIGVVLAFRARTSSASSAPRSSSSTWSRIAMLRELGMLLTAIIVAGRSASAFTAQIGSMKVREEIDAMRTLGLDPIEMLVVPRVLALMLTLPLLGFIADIAGLIGGAAMAWLDLGVSPVLFVERLRDTIGVWHFCVGMIKAPVFAVVIGIDRLLRGPARSRAAPRASAGSPPPRWCSRSSW